jgi:hypothetical protein
MRLTKIEKKEMLEDGKSKKRMRAFRSLRASVPKMSFEEYADWLMQLQSMNPVKQKKRFVVYKNVKI